MWGFRGGNNRSLGDTSVLHRGGGTSREDKQGLLVAGEHKHRRRNRGLREELSPKQVQGSEASPRQGGGTESKGEAYGVGVVRL